MLHWQFYYSEILKACEQDKVGISAKYSFTQTGK